MANGTPTVVIKDVKIMVQRTPGTTTIFTFSGCACGQFADDRLSLDARQRNEFAFINTQVSLETRLMAPQLLSHEKLTVFLSPRGNSAEVYDPHIQHHPTDRPTVSREKP